MKKRIAHISTAHYSDDPRIVYKECYSLAKKYNVHLFCLKGANTDSLSRKGITFNPLKKNRKLIRRIFGNQFRVLSLCKKHSIEVAHLHDPELILSAFILKILGKEVIFDIHENFHRRTYKNKSLKFFFMNLFQKFYIWGLLVVVIFELKVHEAFDNRQNFCELFEFLHPIIPAARDAHVLLWHRT